jgi:hypothetical protein
MDLKELLGDIGMARKKSSIKNKRLFWALGAIALLLLAVPVGVWIGNQVNGWRADSYAYDQMENVTSEYYEAPIIESSDTEAKVVSLNDTTITEETPTWDTTSEWDQVIITSTGTDVSLIFNLNISAEDLLRSNDFQVRMKFNGSKPLDVSIETCKFDGITLTTSQVWSKSISNGSQVAYWNWTPTEILEAHDNLNQDPTDESWIRIVIEGGDTSKLTTGDTVQFQVAIGGPDNLLTWSSYGIMTTTATLLGIGLAVMALFASPLVNPVSGGGYLSKGYKKYRRS